ncbi:GNAT family N-acetyltransferase [Fusibacter bizertensis]|uniref:GNAT family N-acetyltransferase n=1 Tax=Fusibacter bizertensis TaxID=1488331 RepID=A0ABT6N9V4_9FIRM|nr:GNAT family N-acetyltransferase [Fusibacter bizertensis]MDH8677197.1 GNAT family N-acetyltransferase [Fusibacter bizertensis]
MTLQTQRLTLIALSRLELETVLEDIEKFTNLTGIGVGDTIIDEHLQYAFDVRLKKVLENEMNYLWNTVWIVALKEQKTMIGALMIKGVPDAKGDVIVGYGIDSSYQRKGYASEGLNGLKDWIFSDSSVNAIFGDTDIDNYASHKVLINAGAVNFLEKNDTIWWKISR